MAGTLGRALYGDVAAAAALTRRLCTAAAAEAATSSPVVAKAAKGLPLYRRLSALGGAPEGSVKKAMNKWLREGRTARAKEIVTYVKELRKYGRFRHALELMEWMDEKGMNMSYGNYALRVDLLSKVKGVGSAEQYFNDLPEPAKNRLTYGALLNIFCVEKMEDKAMELYEKMKQLNCDSNTLVYNQLMNLFSKKGIPEKVLSLLHEMKGKNISRDCFTYNILITSYASLGNMEAVDRVVQDIEEEDTSLLQWPIYGNLASIYLSAGLVEKAELCIKKLEEVMDKKDRLAYHFLISLYARLGNALEVNRVWKSLTAKMKTTNKSYLVIFHALNKLDDFNTLKICFQEWDSSSELYDIRLVNMMIGAYLKRDMIEEAEALQDSAASKGAKSDYRTFDLFIEYYLRKKEIYSALKCFEDAVSTLELWKPKQAVVDAFFKYFEETKDANGAKTFQKSLKTVQDRDSEEHNPSHSAKSTLDECGPFKPADEKNVTGTSSETVKFLEKTFLTS